MSARFGAAVATSRTSTNVHFSILLCDSNCQNDPEQCANCNKASTFGSQESKDAEGRKKLLENRRKCLSCFYVPPIV